MKRTISAVILMIVLFGVITLAFNIQPAKAGGTIYIKADGSIDPLDAPISNVGNVYYTFTADIYDSIVVERNNIIIDGDRRTLQSPVLGSGTGISLSGRENVTIKNITIKNYQVGAWLNSSFNYNSISGNIITNNSVGIRLSYSSNFNSISGNNITNNGYGILLHYSSNYNSISGNNITNNSYGIIISSSSGNSVSGNNITANNQHGIGLISSSGNSVSGNNITANNGYGISLDSSSNNTIFHNNFINNTNQVSSGNSVNTWDDSYPSGGNYWSDYENRYPDATEINHSGIWNTPYVIDANNQDNYPKIIPEFPSGVILPLFMMVTLIAVLLLRRKRRASYSRPFLE